MQQRYFAASTKTSELRDEYSVAGSDKGPNQQPGCRTPRTYTLSDRVTLRSSHIAIFCAVWVPKAARLQIRRHGVEDANENATVPSAHVLPILSSFERDNYATFPV